MAAQGEGETRYCPGVALPPGSRRWLGAASRLAFVLALTASVARAQPRATSVAPGAGAAPATPEEEAVAPGLRGPRLGATPGVGIGFAGFTGNVAYPSFVFTTAIQIEGLLELTRWGFFARGGFISAGSSGRWTAPTFALGSQYRLVGDGEERWGLVVRAGGIFARWTATPSSGSCDIFYFIPNSCQNYVEPSTPTPGTPAVTPPAPVTAESIGLLAAVRLEAPVEPVFVALDGELSVARDIDQSVPGAAITGQLVLTFALRDHALRRAPQTFEPGTRLKYYDR